MHDLPVALFKLLSLTVTKVPRFQATIPRFQVTFVVGGVTGDGSCEAMGISYHDPERHLD